MPKQTVNIKRLNNIQAAPLGVQKIPKGTLAPDPSDLPVADMPEYEREVKDPKDHTTIEDRLVYLCDALGGAVRYREPTEDGVTLKVKLKDGTVLAGQGATTRDAFNALLDKTQRFFNAGFDKEVAK